MSSVLIFKNLWQTARITAMMGLRMDDTSFTGGKNSIL